MLINVTSSDLQKAVVFVCYLVPTFALLLFGRAGNISLIIVTIVITVLLYPHVLRMKKTVIDFTAHAA